jgi:hypothetical protein
MSETAFRNLTSASDAIQSADTLLLVLVPLSLRHSGVVVSEACRQCRVNPETLRPNQNEPVSKPAIQSSSPGQPPRKQNAFTFVDRLPGLYSGAMYTCVPKMCSVCICVAVMPALFAFFSAAPPAASSQLPPQPSLLSPPQPSLLSPPLPLSSFQRSLRPSLLSLEFTLFNSAAPCSPAAAPVANKKKIFILGQLLLEAKKQEKNPFFRPCRPSIAYKRSRTHFRQKQS